MGPWSDPATHTIVGKDTPPDSVAGLSYTTDETGITITWNQCPNIDYKDTTIRVGYTWETGNNLYTGSANKLIWARPPAGTYSIWAKHRDTNLNESTTAATISITYTPVSIDNSTIKLGDISGSLGHLQFNDDVLIINLDNTDIDAELRFGRTIGGTASMTWNGDLLQVSKPLKPVEIGINNISATTPTNPFAGQIWIQP